MMKRIIIILFLAFNVSIVFAQIPSGKISCSYNDNFDLEVKGVIKNNRTDATITSVELIMFYGNVRADPNNMWKSIQIIKVSIGPSDSGNFTHVFKDTTHEVKASSCCVSRVRYDDGTIYKSDALDRNGLTIYLQ